MQKHKIITISQKDNNFPDKLSQLAQVPTNLYASGYMKLLSASPAVGIVGSRKVSSYGREVTDTIARELASRGVVIVSGLALGVDSISHRAALEVHGKTIAVLPTGIKSIYPASHIGLSQQIVDKRGLLLSEYPESAGPMKYQFIERNRIIAALSDVLIITEAAENSGSLHTARFALELGRTVMAVPGPITSPGSRGTNKLIQTGATPVLSYVDVLHELGIDENISSTKDYYPENTAEQSILEQIKMGNYEGGEILKEVSLTASEFQTHLTMLEIKGVISASGGRWYMK